MRDFHGPSSTTLFDGTPIITPFDRFEFARHHDSMPHRVTISDPRERTSKWSTIAAVAAGLLILGITTATAITKTAFFGQAAQTAAKR